MIDVDNIVRVYFQFSREDGRITDEIAAAREKTKAKLAIIKKLENVRGLVSAIKNIGEAVGDVSSHHPKPAGSLNFHYQIHPAIRAAFSGVNFMTEVQALAYLIFSCV